MAEEKKTTAAKKAPAKKAPTKKVEAKKTEAKKAAPKKATAAKKAAPKTTEKKVAAPKAKASAAKMKIATFRVKRGERFQEYEVKYDDSTTVLSGLEQIKGEQDGSLTFRRSCRASICGSCGMKINDRSRLACKTKIKDMVGGIESRNYQGRDVITIMPQGNQEVIKDLVVDLTTLFNKVEGLDPYIKEGSERIEAKDKTAYEQVNAVSNCIMCGLCFSDCTELEVNAGFHGPAALAKAFRFVADPREGQKTDRLKTLSEQGGIWDCVRCGMCVDACPKGVAPMEAIGKLRHRAIEAGITNNKGAKHAIVFKDDILNGGLLNEPKMLIKTTGILGAFHHIPDALNLAKKGKVPSFFPEKIEGLDEVKRLFKVLDETELDVETKVLDEGPGAG